MSRTNEWANKYSILIEHEPFQIDGFEKTDENWIKVGAVKIIKGEPLFPLDEHYKGRIYVCEIKAKQKALALKKQIEQYIDELVSKRDRTGHMRFVYWAAGLALQRLCECGIRVVYNDYYVLFPESRIAEQ